MFRHERSAAVSATCVKVPGKHNKSLRYATPDLHASGTHSTWRRRAYPVATVAEPSANHGAVAHHSSIRRLEQPDSWIAELALPTHLPNADVTVPIEWR
jgi:hypothetical protein